MNDIEELEAHMVAERPKSDAKLEALIRAKQAAASIDDPGVWGDPASLQSNIDTGLIWRLEGSAGRTAMDALESGCCFLPLSSHLDYYGNRVPNRLVLKPGTKGTLLNSARFWDIPVKGKKKA